jgi:hypothetical protein
MSNDLFSVHSRSPTSCTWVKVRGRRDENEKKRRREESKVRATRQDKLKSFSFHHNGPG